MKHADASCPDFYPYIINENCLKFNPESCRKPYEKPARVLFLFSADGRQGTEREEKNALTMGNFPVMMRAKI